MAKRAKGSRQTTRAARSSPHLPKGTILRTKIGQSFAEYDKALEDENVWVRTPAFNVALDAESGKYFFVGRRGTGKTATRTYCDVQVGHSRVIVPEIFSPSSSAFGMEVFENSRKGPFRSLVSVFKRSMLDEVLLLWHQAHSTYADLPPIISSELNTFCRQDFDTRTLQLIANVSRGVAFADDQVFIAENKATKALLEEMKHLQSGGSYALLIDSIDDFWDGSDQALVYLTAFMHACLEMSSQLPWARALLFLRENIFERVRARDSESSRIETAVVALDWNRRQLLELVERRLNRALTAKLALGGPTWDAFFEQPGAAKERVFDYCYHRPRDVLIYVSHAIDLAQERGHEQILVEDVDSARRRFSDNRFKDLGDEYAENFPQIAVVLTRFYGLGRSFTPGGMEAFIRKLLQDAEVKRACASWIFENQALESFVRLLYNIGFIGLRRPGQPARFRALGPQETSPPAISDDAEIVIHKCYWDALDLQDVLVRSLPEDQEFGRIGIILDLPGGLDQTSYIDELDLLNARLDSIPLGPAGAEDFEQAVGDVLKLCFFRSLENPEHRVRTVTGEVIRDWIASNRAQTGFWAAMRQRYDALQVVWECKNYEQLKSSDFHQVSYYMANAIGRFVVIAYRGEMQGSYYQHIRRISEQNGMVLPLGIRDLKTFVRQNRNGKIKEDHLQDRYDSIARKVS